MNNITIRLRKLEKAQKGGFSNAPALIIPTENGWQLTVSSGGKQFTSLHTSEAAACAVFEKMCRGDCTVIILDV